MAKELTRDTDVKVMRLVGGHIKRTLKSPPVKEVDLLIGTIGAVSKYSTLPVIKLNCVRHVVLDEADTLFDDSFRGKMMNFLRRIPVSSFSSCIIFIKIETKVTKDMNILFDYRLDLLLKSPKKHFQRFRNSHCPLLLYQNHCQKVSTKQST